MPAADPGQAFAAVLVDELARNGVTDAVLAPGSRSTPLALALASDERIALHVRIDERSASFTAVGLARTTGRAVPLLCTSGTAAAEFHAAVLECDQSRVPLLVLTADRPPELRGTGANQTLDQIKLYGTAVRWFDEVGVPEARPDAVAYWRATVSHAVAAAVGSLGPPGPVHLNISLREPLVPTAGAADFAHPLDGRPDGQPWTRAISAARPLPADVRRRLTGARAGVVLAGDLPAAGDGAAVAAFAQLRGWPLIAEPHSNARQGAAAMVGADALLRDSQFVADNVPDVVVVCGRLGLSRAVLAWVGSARCEVVVVDPYGAWWDPTRSASAVVAADLQALAEAEGPTAAEWLESWQRAGVAVQDAIDAVLDEQELLTEPRLARDLVAGLPDGAMLAVASSMPIRDLDLTMRPRSGLRVVANRGVSGIDGFVSTAVGAALGHARADGTGPAWALAGDLSLLHDVNGLLADPAPDLSIVVANNDGGGIFSLLPQAASDGPVFERIFGTPHGADLSQVVAGYGGNHRVLSHVEELNGAVTTTPKGLQVLEVRTDRRENATLHRRLSEAAAAAVPKRR
ncbi:MAG: 2-succinyl-5-enolpyruvyl-6-hydroxy-3-cyclohexene-carboxylate synthase [Actinomycetota bacterium]|nr:2-succinyl-5-enolpyruvyl-6-hydroxy-3-cyclohexene-carboxylate synthase [Actinomycetota bacterium]